MTTNPPLGTNQKLDSPAQTTGGYNNPSTDVRMARLDVISTAFDDVNLTEPSSAYQSRYPYNSAEQTLSGHLFEKDDTPGAERIVEQHKAGTFYEIHPDGTKVTKIFGDDYYIALQDHVLVVGGNLHIVVQGNASLLVKGDMKQKIDGNLTTIVNGNHITRVAGNTLNYTKGTTNIQSNGDMSLRTNAVFELYSLGNAIIRASKSLLQRAGSGIRLFSKSRIFVDGSRIDLNSGGGDVGTSKIKNLDPTAGLTVATSVVSPSVETQQLNKVQYSSLGNLLAEEQGITYPKDRVKSKL